MDVDAQPDMPGDEAAPRDARAAAMFARLTGTLTVTLPEKAASPSG